MTAAMRSPVFLAVLAMAAPAAGQRLDYQPVSDEDLAAPAQLAYQAVDVPDPAAADPTLRTKKAQSRHSGESGTFD